MIWASVTPLFKKSLTAFADPRILKANLEFLFLKKKIVMIML